jgi:hypothetical protein
MRGERGCEGLQLTRQHLLLRIAWLIYTEKSL